MSVSTLRAVCHRCRTHTAVAVDDGYECHSCGAVSAAGLVRVPSAFGAGGEAMAEAAWLPLPYPEAAVVDRSALEEQTAALAAGLPARPLVLGGCCCAHTGAIRGLSARVDRLAVVWLDAHGDVNTEASSPSGERVGNAAASGARRRRRATGRRRAGRRTQPRSGGGRLPGRTRASTTTWPALSRAPTVSTSRSIATCSTRRRSTASCPSRAGSRSRKRSACSAAWRQEPRRSLGMGLTGLRPTADVRVLTRLVSSLGL